MMEQTKHVARPRKKPEEMREQLSTTVSNGLPARLKALQATTGLDVSTLVDKGLLRILPLFEADPSEILKTDPLQTSAADQGSKSSKSS